MRKEAQGGNLARRAAGRCATCGAVVLGAESRFLQLAGGRGVGRWMRQGPQGAAPWRERERERERERGTEGGRRRRDAPPISSPPPSGGTHIFETQLRRRPVGMGGGGAALERRRSGGFPLSGRDVAAAAGVVAGFALGLIGVYLSLPASDYSFLKLPRSLEDIQILRDHLEDYTSDYTLQVLVGYCTVYIFMQTFMIPGTIFMSLLAGALFGVLRGVALVVFAATAGASSCYFLSRLIGRPLVFSLWPDKLSFFQAQVARRRKKLLNYMLFLRVTPTLPNTFINVASPIVDVPYHIFFLATFIGLIPATYVTVRAGIALGELRSIGDLYDFHSMATLLLIGVISVTPTLISKSQS